MAFFFIYDPNNGGGLGWGTVQDAALEHHSNQIAEATAPIDSATLAEIQHAGGGHYFRWDGEKVVPKTQIPELVVTGNTTIVADGKDKIDLSWSWPKPLYLRINHQLVGPFRNTESFTTRTPGRYQIRVDDPEVWSDTLIVVNAHGPESIRG